MSNDNWRTPQEVIDWLSNRFGQISIDLCSSGESNSVAPFYITKDDDFLDLSNLWKYQSMIGCGSRGFINCPYSNPMPFVSMAARWAGFGFGVMGILNYDPSTAWFELIEKEAAVIMPIVGGRIAFIDDRGDPVPSNNKPQFMFYLAPFGRATKRAIYEPVSINEIYPNGKPKRKRVTKVTDK